MSGEINAMRLMMLELTKVGARVFRNNVAQGVVGKVTWIKREGAVCVGPGDAVVRNARVLHAGLCEGSSDLIGIMPVLITPAHVGQTIGVFVAVEAKAKTAVTHEQERFITAIHKLGGLSGIARTAAEAVHIVRPRGEAG